jgi:hypothetical protein
MPPVLLVVADLFDARLNKIVWIRRNNIYKHPLTWGDENSHVRAFNFYRICIPLLGCKVSGVSVQRCRWPEKRPV